MFRLWVHPAGFVLVCLLKDGVGDTKVQEHSTVGVFLAEPVSTENLVPELVVFPHPGVEVPEYQDFLLMRYCLYGTVELLVKAFQGTPTRSPSLLQVLHPVRPIMTGCIALSQPASRRSTIRIFLFTWMLMTTPSGVH